MNIGNYVYIYRYAVRLSMNVYGYFKLSKVQRYAYMRSIYVLVICHKGKYARERAHAHAGALKLCMYSQMKFGKCHFACTIFHF